MIIKGIDYKINRETARVSEFDKAYCELVDKIITEGELFENRTGIDTLSIEGVNFKFNVGKEFPILESKKVAVYNALSEILWIYQEQSNEVSWLQKRGNKTWNEWVIDKDGIYRIYEPVKEGYVYESDKKVVVKDVDGNDLKDKNGNLMYASSLIEGKTIKEAKFFGKKYSGTIGTAYGWINNEYKRPQYVLQKLKDNPHDRRMNIVLWQDAHIKTAVLPSCVWSTEWKVTDNKLNCYVHQRSADVPLGLPFNISQYAMLLAMFAKVSNLEVGSLNWSIMDAHIYVNQLDGIKLQLERYKKMIYYEEYIKNHSDIDIKCHYSDMVHDKLRKELVLTKEELVNYKEYQELCDDIRVLEHMITKEKPILELANKDDFFKFSNDVNTDKEYLKENATGNSDVKVLKYKSLPYISMPIAQ